MTIPGTSRGQSCDRLGTDGTPTLDGTTGAKELAYFFPTSIWLAPQGLCHAGSEQSQHEGVSLRRMPEAGAAGQRLASAHLLSHTCLHLTAGLLLVPAVCMPPTICRTEG